MSRPAMTAIAAAIACSTPSFAQSADPPAAETPAPVAAAPVAAEPIVPDAPVAVDTLAPAEAVAKPAVRKATTAKAAPVRARPAPTRTASAAPAVAAAPPPAAADVVPVAEPPAVEPLPIEPEAAPVVAPVETADASSMDGMMLPIAAGGLALLALAGAALLLRRRKRRAAETEEFALREEELAAIDDAEPAMTAEPAMMVEPEPEPLRAPAGQFGRPAYVTAAAPSVIAPQPSAQIDRSVTASEPSPEIDGPATDVPDDVAPGSRVEAAYAGPTADNPSLSIKKRLKRAAFFDQREMLVEAGEATPVAEDAGLPDALDPAPDTRDPIDKAQ